MLRQGLFELSMVWNRSWNLVSGTKTAVKRAPMMQSAPYNQNVPENFSGDSTWIRKDESQTQDYSENLMLSLWKRFLPGR